MSELELEMFQAVPNLEFNTYWIPCTWFIALLKDTKKSNRITDSQGLQTIIQVFEDPLQVRKQPIFDYLK